MVVAVLTFTNGGSGVVESSKSGDFSVMMKQASAKAEQGMTARKATRMLMKIKNSSGTKPARERACVYPTNTGIVA